MAGVALLALHCSGSGNGGSSNSLPTTTADGSSAIYYNNTWHAQDRYGYSVIDKYDVFSRTLTGFSSSGSLYYVSMATPEMSLIGLNNEVIITWNGVDYRCHTQEYPSEENKFVGNMSLKYNEYEDTGEPFLYISAHGEFVDTWFVRTNDDVDITVYTFDEYVTKFDQRFIPGWAEILSNFAPAYSVNSTYAVGDYCIHDNALYKCKTAIEEEEFWDDTHWERTTICDEINA